MAWSNKSKNAVPDRSNKAKILQQSADREIRTPDNQTILVGASVESEPLLYREEFNNWNLKTKISA